MIEAATGQPAGSGIPEMDPVRKYVLLVLRQAWRDGASEVVFGESAGPKEQAGVPVKYLVAGRWYDMTPFPEHLWAQVVMQLMRMAGAELVPAAGDILSEWEGTMFWWRLTAPSLEGPLRLKRAQAWNVGGLAASSDDPTSPPGGM